jgi:hypothetical protein
LRRLPNFSIKAPVGFIRTGDHWAAGSSGVLSFFLLRRTSMSIYLKKGKGWRYDFTLNGQRYTKGWFKTKKEANQAEAQKREELQNPPTVSETSIDMAFSALANEYLDHAKRKFAERPTSTRFMFISSFWHLPGTNLSERSMFRLLKLISGPGRRTSITTGTRKISVPSSPGPTGAG